MRAETPMIGEAMAELREEIDTKLRFKKTLMGYDTAEVDDYFRGQRTALEYILKCLEEEKSTGANLRTEAEEELKCRDAKASILKQQLSVLEQKLSDVERLLEEEENEKARFLDQEEELRHRNAQDADLMGRLSYAEQKLSDMEQALAGAQEKNETQEEELRRRDAQAANLMGQLSVAEQKLSGMEQALAGAQEKNEAQEEELRRRDAQAESLTGQIRDAEQKLSGLQQLLVGAQEKNKEQEDELCRLDTAGAALKERLSSAENLMKEADQKVARAEEAALWFREREHELIEKLEESAETVEKLRSSVELKNLARMRAQLMAASRESSESNARHLMLKQENKQLYDQVQTLTEECHTLSSELGEKKAHYHEMVLEVEKGMDHVRSLNRMNFLELSARLKEAFGLANTYCEEFDTIVAGIDDSLADHTAQLRLIPVEPSYTGSLELLQNKSPIAAS